MEIKNRNDLIKWLEDHCRDPFILRALVYGENEMLGGFTKIPPISSKPGWIVKVTAQYGGVRYVVVIPSLKDYGIFMWLDDFEIPWAYWEGDTSPNPLYQGDNPEIYKEKRDEARKTPCKRSDPTAEGD